MHIVYCDVCNSSREVKYLFKQEKIDFKLGVQVQRKCRSCSKRILNSQRSRKTVTCLECGIIRNVKRSTQSGYTTCRSCAAKKTSVRSNSPAAVKKRFETIRRNGKLWSSRPEERLYELLIQRFGCEDVIHHISVNNYRIDFYVKICTA